MSELAAAPPLQLAGGLPDVVADARALRRCVAAVAGGVGPVAVDAERASGHRYGNRAYLVQLRREGSGTWLVDPVSLPDLGSLARAIGDAEWVLHAATQDLPCLADLGLRPSSLFDTELGARLAGQPRVGLGAVIEHYLGFTVAKEHSAVDWSRRPLPEAWLRYAALDVEVLLELREAIDADLRAQGKQQWAREEFDALVSFTGPAPRVDPWRRTSGVHRIGTRRGLAVLRELWYARDRIAQRRDVSPSRLLPDAVLVELALAPPSSPAGMGARRELRAAARNRREWLAAIERGRSLPEEELPPVSAAGTGPPPPRVWRSRHPVAAARLTRARTALAAFAAEHSVPVENVLAPELLRRLAWSPPGPLTEDAVSAELRALGARHWQASIAAPIIVKAFADEA